MHFVVNGKAAFASTGGRPHKPSQRTIVYVHGSGQNRLTWTQQGRKAAYRGYNVVALDLPGHGNSHGPALERIEQIADWIIAAMDALSIDSAVIVAHSQGVLDAIELASRYGERIEAAILVAGALSIPVNDALVRWSKDDPRRAFASMVGWGLGEVGQLHDHSVPGHSHIGTGVNVMAINDPDTLYADLSACNAYSRDQGTKAASKIACPCLVVLGTNDKMTPIKFGRQLVEALNDVESIEFIKTGHMIPVERPQELNGLIFEFLER